jgi:hypothetical protein
MKLAYKPLTYKYRLHGTKTIKESNRTTELREDLFVEPRMALLFTNYQKLRFTRKPDMGNNESVSDSFAKDSANVLDYFELKLTPKGEPYYVVNNQDLKKKWSYESVILRSKYTGDWVNRELGLMTEIMDDEKKLLAAILQDFCLNELYNRKIYTIAFDKNTHTGRQMCVETTLDGIPLIFEQECKFKQYLNEQVVEIEGKALINENLLPIGQLCEGKNFKPEDITDITQRTVYRAFGLLNFPEKIETVFKVNGKEGCLKETSILIETLKKNSNE